MKNLISRILSNLSVAQSSLLILVLFSAMIYSSCQKKEDFQSNPIESGLLSEIMALYESAQHSGASVVTPFGAVPVFEEAIERAHEGVIGVVAPVHGLPLNEAYGANLVFYKDQSGNVISNLAIWKTEPATPYHSNWLPIEGKNNFSGEIAFLNTENIIVKHQKWSNGKILNNQMINLRIESLLSISSSEVQFRDPIDILTYDGLKRFWNTLIHVMNPGPSGGNTTGGGPYGSNTTSPFYQYNIFMTTCNDIRQWVVAAEQDPTLHPEYYTVDYKLCEFIHELSQFDPAAAHALGFCLWKNHLGSSLLNNAMQTWAESDKSANAAAQMFTFLENNVNCG